MLNASSRLLSLALTCIILSGVLWSQGITTGTITGVVLDDQGALVTNARITALQNGTNVISTAVTNGSGEFQIRSLPVGTYQVTISAQGFEDINIPGVVVNAGQPTTVGRQSLQVAGSVQNVQVEAISPLLQTDPTQTSATFESKKLEDLPLGNGLDVVTLLTPGVVTGGDLAGITSGNGASFAVNGQRPRDNNYEIDGQSNNDPDIAAPIIFFGNQDAIEEIQVFTNYSAEYGRATGSIINYITKQGSNQFHGSGYEIYNGNWGDSLTNQSKSALFGNCPSGVAAGTPTAEAPGGCNAPHIPRLVDNRFGVAVGGPIVLNKLWIFGSTNIDLTRTGVSPISSNSAVTPDPTGIAELATDFPNNPAVNFLKQFGPASVPGTLIYGPPTTTQVGSYSIEEAPVTRLLATPFHDYEATGRVDWQMTDKDRIFGRYIFQQTLTTGMSGSNGIAAGDFVNNPARDQQIGIDYTRTFSSSFLDQIRYSYGRENLAFEGGNFPDCTRATYGDCPTAIAFDDSTLPFGGDPVFPQGRFLMDHQLQDNANQMHGKHFLKWGGEFHRESQPIFSLPNINGDYVYETFEAFVLDNQPGESGSPGSAPAQLSLANGPAQINFHENQYALYFQDDWKALDNLTISMGLRYELFGQANNVLHDETVARESNPATAFWDPSLPLSQRTVPYLPLNTKNFGPIAGFAYTPKLHWLGKDATVIRGGFRIAYDPAFYNIFTDVSSYAPVVNAGIISCNECLPAAGTGAAVTAANLNQLPVGGNPGAGFTDYLPPRLSNPYTEAWQFGIQHEFGQAIVGEVRYVGNHAVHQYQTVDGNPYALPLELNGFASSIPASVTPCTDTTQVGYGYVNCNRTLAYENTNGGYSFYDGMQSRLDLREWHGLTAGISYTFSKTIDNATEAFATGNGGNTTEFSQNAFNPNERGLSGIDYPNDFTIYMLYQLPFKGNQNSLLGKVLGGWEASPVYRYNSGQLYSVLQNHPFWESNGVVPGSTTGSLCDPNGLFYTDICRPILSNPNAAMGTIGMYCNPSVDPTGCPVSTLVVYDPNSPTGEKIDPTTLKPIPVSSQNVHWIFNDVMAANVLGTPFGGAPRNLYRGDSVNTVNFSLQKEIKFRERYGLELRITAYNLLNRMFLGTPNVNISSGSAFGTNVYNLSGGGSNQTNVVFQGLAQRHFELKARITF